MIIWEIADSMTKDAKTFQRLLLKAWHGKKKEKKKPKVAVQLFALKDQKIRVFSHKRLRLCLIDLLN